jgi:DNA-binding GntR family transcriptional regulator
LASPGPESAPTSRVDSAYRKLREAIIEGDYPPGSPLRHSELADAFGVSLIPIREAIRKLEVERLVDSIPNKGARVAPISLEDVDDVYQTRVALETEALRRAWPNLTPEVVEEIAQTRERMVERVRRDDETFYELHRRVHFEVYERSGSPWLVHLIEILWSHTERYRRLAAKLDSFVDEGSDLHGMVLDAIRSQDREAAEEALRNDLQRTARLMFAAYQDEEAEAAG